MLTIVADRLLQQDNLLVALAIGIDVCVKVTVGVTVVVSCGLLSYD